MGFFVGTAFLQFLHATTYKLELDYKSKLFLTYIFPTKICVKFAPYLHQKSVPHGVFLLLWS